MDEYNRDLRDEVTDLLLEGFSSKLTFFTKNRDKLEVAFRDEIRADMFYVGELDGSIAGIWLSPATPAAPWSRIETRYDVAWDSSWGPSPTTR